ncbi:MAG: zf-HC2 domain-containing protein [Planctomycetes bacterium]|nr:zf-HC2 domain-containing protein [Planctomycetota bacterium]
MDCRRVDALLLDYVYGELPGRRRASIALHLEGCAGCRARAGSYEATRAAFAGLPPVEPSATASKRVLFAARGAASQVAAEVAAGGAAPRSGWIAAVAAAVLAGAVGWYARDMATVARGGDVAEGDGPGGMAVPVSLGAGDPLRATFEIATSYYRQRKFAHAVDYLSLILDRHPECPLVPYALHQRACARWGMKDLEGAARDFARLVEGYPRYERLSVAREDAARVAAEASEEASPDDGVPYGPIPPDRVRPVDYRE